MFRCVVLPPAVPGRLLLHSLPGRYEALEQVWHQVRTDKVRAIVCLTERDEIHVKSYEYAQEHKENATKSSPRNWQSTPEWCRVGAAGLHKHAWPGSNKIFPEAGENPASENR